MSEELNGGQPTEVVEGNETLENEVEFSEEERGAWDEDLSKKVDSLSAQKKHWREKHDKVLKELEQLRAAPKPEPKEEKKPQKVDEIAQMRAEMQHMKLAHANPSLSSDQIERAVKWATAEGTDPQTFINSPEFQAILGAQKQREAAENAAPNPSTRSGSGSMDFSQVSADQIASMDDATYEKYQKWELANGGANKSGLTVKHRVGL